MSNTELSRSPGEDAKLSIFSRIARTIRQAQTCAKPFVVGITGIDSAGKTEFSMALARHLIEHGNAVQIIHLDDFQNPKRIRYAGPNEPENYFERSFNLQELVSTLLEPIAEARRATCTLTHLDVITDEFTVRRDYNVDPQTIVLFEGVFLFREELIRFLDYRIYLDIPFEVARERIVIRDVPRFGPSVIDKVDRKYLAAQSKYIMSYNPATCADLVLDNSDWKNPRILRG